MYCIRYTVDNETALWCDINIRGNREPMIFTERDHADKECEFLSIQYANEGFHFTVANHTSIPKELPC